MRTAECGKQQAESCFPYRDGIFTRMPYSSAYNFLCLTLFFCHLRAASASVQSDSVCTIKSCLLQLNPQQFILTTSVRSSAGFYSLTWIVGSVSEILLATEDRFFSFSNSYSGCESICKQCKPTVIYSTSKVADIVFSKLRLFCLHTP